MKKILLVAAVACMTMVSCKKDYTCECETETGISGSTTKTTTTYTFKDKKAGAETSCDALDYDTSIGTAIAKNSCSIK